jgi:hypothetical protein
MDQFEDHIQDVSTLLDQLHLQQAQHHTRERDEQIEAWLKYLAQHHSDAIGEIEFLPLTT